MSIFNKRKPAAAGSYKVAPTMESRMSIVMEATNDMNSVFAGLYAVDVNLEHRAVIEGANVSILTENVFKSAWNKLKEIWTKFKEKISAWFKAVKEYLTTLFMSGKKFVQKYGKEVEKRVGALTTTQIDKFSYKGYKFAVEDKSVEYDKVVTKLNAVAGESKDAILEAAKEADEAKSVKTYEQAYDMEKEFGTSEDLKKKIKEEILGGSASEVLSYKDGLTAAQMVAYVNGFDKAVKAVESAEKATVNGIDAVINACKTAGDKDNAINGKVREILAIIKRVIAYHTTAVIAKKDAMDVKMKQCVRVLKKLFNFRPKMESVTVDDSDLDVTDEPIADTVAATVVGEIDPETGDIAAEGDYEAENLPQDEQVGEPNEEGKPLTNEEEAEELLESMMKLF